MSSTIEDALGLAEQAIHDRENDRAQVVEITLRSLNEHFARDGISVGGPMVNAYSAAITLELDDRAEAIVAAVRQAVDSTGVHYSKAFPGAFDAFFTTHFSNQTRIVGSQSTHFAKASQLPGVAQTLENLVAQASMRASNRSKTALAHYAWSLRTTHRDELRRNVGSALWLVLGVVVTKCVDAVSAWIQHH